MWDRPYDSEVFALFAVWICLSGSLRLRLSHTANQETRSYAERAEAQAGNRDYYLPGTGKNI